jgi:hypothetical protein
MSLTITHGFVSGITDDPAAAAAGEVQPGHWNATHTISGLFVAPPANNTSAGDSGSLAFDSAFFYVCVATNLWLRLTGATPF